MNFSRLNMLSWQWKIFIFCQCRRRYVYNIISDVAVTCNKLNQQIKQDAYTTALSQKCDQLNNIGSRFGVPVPSCVSLKLWVQTQNFATCCRSLQPGLVGWNRMVNKSTWMCSELISFLSFISCHYYIFMCCPYLMPACDNENSRQKFPTLIEKFHVFNDYATRKGMVKPHVNK